jgi:hypothetical protein
VRACEAAAPAHGQQLVVAIYDAAVDSGRWPDFLTQVEASPRLGSSHLFLQDTRIRSAEHRCVRRCSHANSGSAHSINEQVLQVPDGLTAAEAHAAAALARRLAPTQIAAHHGVSLLTERTQLRAARFAVQHGRGEKAFEPGNSHTVHRRTPHRRRAIVIMRRLGGARLTTPCEHVCRWISECWPSRCLPVLLCIAGSWGGASYRTPIRQCQLPFLKRFPGWDRPVLAVHCCGPRPRQIRQVQVSRRLAFRSLMG